MTTRVASILLAAAWVGCASLAPTPPVPPPTGVARLAVSKPANLTPNTLLVSDPGPLERRLLNRERETVPDILGQDLRDVLARQGFIVVSETSSGTSPTLQTEVRRWEPYAADYSAVTVDVVATLVAPGGRELWRVERSRWSIPTRDANSERDASAMASRRIAEDLLANWRPDQPTSIPPPSAR